jgi:2-polyprenyl-6-methoxyphenol hydroxylase-like FAD-dependent oxidoreductase
MAPETDVVVVGAGPTGLMAAGDLAARGVRVTLLERRTEESGLTRAFGVHARTLEMLDARGLADELIATGARARGLRLFGRLQIDLGGQPTRFPFVLITPQYHVERLLRERARRLGAQIVPGTEVVGLSPDGDGVDGVDRVDVRTAAGAVVRASYVIGADGMRSTVRDALGLPFPGVAVLRSIMLADVRLTDAPTDVIAVNAVGGCFAFLAPFGDGWYRVFAWDRRNPQPDSAPVDFDEIRDVTRRALGTDFGMHDPRWMSRFHSDERQVPRYRVGRVFVAGDAAHVHSPAGGQGMNTGIQDAVNLGWKLAATVQGWAPPGLLDSYHDERYAVGRAVLRSSGALIRLAMMSSPIERAARNALGSVLLRIGPIVRRAAGTVTGIGIAYPAPRGQHKLVGRRVDDLALAGGERLYEALRAGTFLVVAPPAHHAAATRWPADRVRAVAPADAGAVLVVRPDAYIGWASDRPSPGDLAAALAVWCGRPEAG